MRIAVIDSPCLICLVHLNLASKLALYFDVIYVPRNVQTEFNKKHRSRYRLNKLFETGTFQKCMHKDETNFQLLTADLDAGEAEGLVQAQEQGAEFFLVDERKAREFGVRQGLTLYWYRPPACAVVLGGIRPRPEGACAKAEARAALPRRR
jgi:predicted nucleic acid-binding protein